MAEAEDSDAAAEVVADSAAALEAEGQVTSEGTVTPALKQQSSERSYNKSALARVDCRSTHVPQNVWASWIAAKTSSAPQPDSKCQLHTFLLIGSAIDQAARDAANPALIPASAADVAGLAARCGEAGSSNAVSLNRKSVPIENGRLI